MNRPAVSGKTRKARQDQAPRITGGLFRASASWTAALLALALLPSAFAQRPGEALWTFETHDVIQSSPALAPDGTIYVGSHDGSLYALNPDGTKKWQFRTAANIPSSPVVATDGTIYIGSLDRTLYALTPGGRIKWLISPRSPIAATPALGHQGDIYVATAFNRLYAISPNGSKRWEFNAGGNLVSSPLVTPGGNICFGCQDGRLYAIDAKGDATWSFQAGDKINSSPALDEDGTIYFGSFDGKLYAIHSDGTKTWEYATGNAIRSSPVIGNNGLVLVGSDDGKLHAVSREGHVRWAHPTGGEVRSSPAVGADGVIYIGSYDSVFHALSSNGSPQWSLKTGGPITASPVIDPNGIVYFGSWDKKLYAVKCSSLGLADAPWPMFRGDARHAGNLGNPASPSAASLQLTHLDSQIELTAPAIVRLFAASTDKATALRSVEFFQGTNSLGQATEAPFTWIGSDTPAGTHTFRARAVFSNGQTAQSPAITVNVRPPRPKSPPAVTVRTPVPPQTVPKPMTPKETAASQPPSAPQQTAKPPRPKPVPPRPSPPPKPEPLPGIAGSFSGLVHSTAVLSHDSLGFLLIDVDKDGDYRGELHYAGSSHGLRGSFDEKGSSTLQIPRRRQKPLNLRLRIDEAKDPDVLTGVISNGRATSEILADRHVYDGDSRRAPEAGRYTLAITGVADDANEYFGNGFGTLTVNEAGEAKFEGALGDGAKIVQTARVSKKGVWSFYAPVHQDKGCVVGWIRFKEQTFGDLFGQLTWIHPADPKDEKLANGFTAELSVIGSRFTPAKRGETGGFPDAGVIALTGEGFRGKTFINEFVVGKNGDVRFPKPSPLKCRLTYRPASGLFSGSFTHPFTGKAAAFQGAFLQKQKTGAGQFQGPNRTGAVTLAPAPSGNAAP